MAEPNQELEKLKQEIERLKKENDVLKAANNCKSQKQGNSLEISGQDIDSILQEIDEQEETTDNAVITETTNPEAMNEDTDVPLPTSVSSTIDTTVDPQEEKESDDEIEMVLPLKQAATPNVGQNAMQIVESAMRDFLEELSIADEKASSIYQTHMDKQERIMTQLCAESLRAMHEFNTSLDPIHSVLRKLKEPLQDTLLKQYISIPCESLDELTTNKTTWGVSPSTHQYNEKNLRNANPHLQSIDLGEEINTKNISASQTDLVLNFFTKARAEQKRIEIKQEEERKKLEEQQQRKAQREAGAATLLSVFPSLTMEEAMTVMEMKSDNIEEASDYSMKTEETELRRAIAEWRKAHTKETDKRVLNRSTTMRSTMNKRVLNRSRTTGEFKSVIFGCTAVTEDGSVTLQSVLDRNNVPLEPTGAKLLHLSFTDFMNCDGIRMVDDRKRIETALKERALCIVFQVIKEENANNLYIPIQFEPACRYLEYELDFDDKTPLDDSCLKSVAHRMDGAVLFRGVYDDGAGLGLVGSAVDDPIEIYSQIIDDVTHNIVCIIFENDVRNEVVIDVKNISFTDQTLQDIIKESAQEFTVADAAGNKISYRIVVCNESVIGVLTKVGNEIKEMQYNEHCWIKEGELIAIPSRNMLGIVKRIPTGLIVTNDPHPNIEKKVVKYAKNVDSKILRKHCADLDGFIDIAVVREGNNEWRDSEHPLCQSFAVTDIKQCSDDEIASFNAYKEENHHNIPQEIMAAMRDVENDFTAIKNRKKDDAISAKDRLNRATNNIKKIHELVSAFNQKSDAQLNDEETKFVKSVNDNINRYQREMRALRFEVQMM